MLEKLNSIEERYNQLKEQSMDPGIVSDNQKMIEISKEMSNMQEKYDLIQEYKKYYNQQQESEELLELESDPEMIEMAKTELFEAKKKLEELDEKLKVALLPTDPNDDKNIFLEIRPAAGWDEAGLFATELMRMYLSYAQKKGRKPEIVEEQMSDIWGVKFVMIKISWDNVYSLMKFESGVHRVQRIPATESQGRVHTSTVTVAIMPEVKNVDVHIDKNDVHMDTFAASSAGWQNANKNQTGVRLHHKPTGTIVTIADSKSQLHNKEKAWEILNAKLYQVELEKQQKEQKDIRWNQIWSGDRSEKIRTYNFPQDRITDHRIKKSWSNIPGVLTWELDQIMEDMVLENQAMLMEQTSKEE